MNQKGLNDMYETGVLVENPISAAKYFRQRMGYINPDEAATKLVEASQYGFQANWRGQTFDKREYIAGVHNGEMPGADTNTDILQARAMNPYSAKSTNRMDYVNPSWQANVSQYGGNSGTIEMLASGFSRALPMAMDNLEQISANALDENKRQAINDPLSSTYALVRQGIQEILATDRAARLAAFRGTGQQDQDVRIDMSKGDAENTFSTSYQGPNMPKLTRVRENPIFQKFKRDRDEIAEAMSKKMIDSLQRVYRPAGAPEPMVPKEARKIFEIDMEDKRRNRIREDRKKRRRLNEEIITAEVLITPEERNLIRKERKNLIIERRKKYILAGKTSISRLEGDEEPVSSMKDVRKSNANYRTLRQKKERQSKFYNYLEERGYDTSELLKSVRSGKTY